MLTTKTVSIVCRFCGGRGKDPFGIMSYISTCCVCGGRGIVTVQSPYIRCAHCSGTGAIKRLTCTACMGKGVQPSTAISPQVCSVCRGSGDDLSASAMYCLQCHGSGVVSVKIMNVE
ncbi:MAG: hypothetical protein QY310_04430 [Candidatus Jettenia sp. CY-1]|uniref:CR-type domain-containing protein n=1 Tax=Candidatus Jettenia ecosi TaxID=2494326 RepID=A0A533QBH0_9BACT|nr:MAG: hypothetical protein JETT_3795 [Candidatus Jettenia ecosi]UJS16011.1 MAG: hypothetical protein L3J17_08755 [Candidatus Jettenia sp.]WKZ19810.1 MAG: hypothetical protein QY310_04430 [Candidatus Jettenia sp. CY-1]